MRLHTKYSVDFLRNFLRFTYETGNVTLNSTVSFSLLAVIVPLCSSTICFAMASPRPAPPPLVLLETSSL